MSPQKITKLIWVLLIISLITILIYYSNRLFNFGINNTALENAMLFFPALLLIMHSCITLGTKRAFTFVSLAALTGLGMEILGLRSGVIFGGYYIYKQTSLMFFDVPYIVPIYWAVFIYTAYCVSNAFIFWLNKEKPYQKKNNLFFLFSLIFFDGLFTVLIDLIMDPIQVYAGTWTWLSKGLYFNIPTGNFVGWFLVTIIVTGIFRTTEYYFPNQPKFDKSIMLIPVIGYAAISISLATSAMNIGYFSLAIISILTLLPISLMNIALFFRRNSP